MGEALVAHDLQNFLKQYICFTKPVCTIHQPTHGVCCINRYSSYVLFLLCLVFDHTIIGASLSEPHTSVTALHTCVCMSACLWTYTENLN